MKTIIFAVNAQDAHNACAEHGLVFEEVVWVLNAQLLSGLDIDGARVIYTPMFQMMPAYAEASAMFGPAL